MLWCALAGTGSLLLLAVSNHITQNIAAVPLLWIVPLAIYLLTFILCFDGKGWYRRDTFLAMLAAGLCVMAWTLADSKLTHELAIQIGVFCGGLFLACMFCHGELVRLKPAPELSDALLPDDLARRRARLGAGRASSRRSCCRRTSSSPAGSSSPHCCCCGRCGAATSSSARSPPPRVLVTIGCAVWAIVEFYDDTIVADAQLLRRAARAGARPRHRQPSPLADPRHDPARHAVPGAGIPPAADDLLHADVGHRAAARSAASRRTTPLKVGVIGLGTGTLASYGAKGDVYRFYDINPAVHRRSRSATSRTCRTATRRSSSRSATRACRSSASRRSSSTCS